MTTRQGTVSIIACYEDIVKGNKRSLSLQISVLEFIKLIFREPCMATSTVGH
jgi:hypothetical protein